MADEVYDVAVVGYGPTGATLANLLAESGLRVLVLEREAAAYHLPRAVHFDDETMRVFQTVGIANELTKKVVVNPGMRFVDEAEHLLLDWPRPQEVGEMGWHASYRLHQPDLEKLLRESLSKRDTADIRTHCEVKALTKTTDYVAIDTEYLSKGEKERFNARFVVGCDGARSFVRNAIGSEMEDLGFQERWLVIDAIINKPRPDLGDYSIQFCSDERPMTYCRSPGMRRRWEITVLDHETDDEITDTERVWELLSRWITPEDADLERRAVYTFHSQIARKWRDGRLLIAGDASHLTPPFMGQGMCTGIRDASNLAWKLAEVIKNKADPSLLDTYQAERAPHARKYIETAMRLGGLINALDQDGAMKLSQGGRQIRSIQPKLGQSTRIDDKASKADLVGRPFPQLTLNTGQKLDDVVGYHSFVASQGDKINDIKTLQLSGSDHPEISAYLATHNLMTVWVGPDRYIYRTANSDGASSQHKTHKLQKVKS